MAFCNFISLLLLSTVALFNAHPTPPTHNNRVMVVQTLLSGDVVNTYEGPTGNCLNVPQDNVPTKIDIVEQRNIDTFRVDLFSTSCFDNKSIEIGSVYQSENIKVNIRRPICAFKLRDTDHRNVNVTFFGIDKTYLVSDHLTCNNICYENQDHTYAFPHSVDFRVRENPTNNGILLFSKTGCDIDDYLWTVTSATAGQRNNLVQKTLRTDVQVKSIRIHKIRNTNTLW